LKLADAGIGCGFEVGDFGFEVGSLKLADAGIGFGFEV
jgi:hypothetical protein